ncbi:MAG TPA: flagellar export chaperone FliS [Desulfonatronum sp.]|mgnify:CR=1 FL=1|nr:flagellar export chaperone FliS [Desulfonatronum sp.]
MYNAARAYLQTQVTTTKPGDVVVLLYEGAINFLKQAKVKITERDVEAKGILISKAMDIISELDASLNTQKGGELGDNLHKLYFYCNTRLLQANLKLEPKLIDEVVTILAGLKSAFAEINQAPISSTMDPGRLAAHESMAS